MSVSCGEIAAFMFKLVPRAGRVFPDQERLAYQPVAFFEKG